MAAPLAATSGRLSKSKIMTGIQCPKRLYLSLFRPDLIPPVSAATQAIFHQGHEVGVEARKEFPNGILIESDRNHIAEAVKRTEAAIQSGAMTLYEAAFIHDNLVVRVDILHRASRKSPWQVIEVKSTTGVKDQHIQDVAIQVFVLREAGLSVKNASIMHLNGEYVYPDKGSLFLCSDVTDLISESLTLLPGLIQNLKRTLLAPKSPEVDIGPHCDEPYECEFRSHCWVEKGVPELSVLDLPGMHLKRKWDFYKNGVVSLTDPKLNVEKLNANQIKMIECFRTGVRLIHRKGIFNELRKWVYPLYFLDFESISFALPRYPGTRPFQQLPFQFSCHIQMQPGGMLIHREFLHAQDSDPRKPLAQALLDVVGSKGSVVAYNKSFESRCLSELSEIAKKASGKLNSIRDRLVDPLPVMRAHVYDHAFRGSFSIKSVAPALLGESMRYDGMQVSNGSEAQIAYQRLISGTLSVQEADQLKKSMLEYCRKDTLAMVQLVEWLRNTAWGSSAIKME